MIIQTRRMNSPWYMSISSSPPFNHAPLPRTARRWQAHAEQANAEWRCPTHSTALRGRTSPQWLLTVSSSGSQTLPWPCTRHLINGAADGALLWRLRSRARTAAYRSGGWIRTNSAPPIQRQGFDGAQRMRLRRSKHSLGSCRRIRAAKFATKPSWWWLPP